MAQRPLPVWNLGCGLFWDFARVTQARFPSGAFFRAALPPPPEKLNPVTLPATRFTRAGFQLPWAPVSDVRSSFSGAGSLRGFISPFLPVTCAAAVGRKGIPPTGAEFRASFFFVFTSPNGYEECQKCPFYIVLPTVVGYQGGRRHRDAIGGTGCEMLACLDQPRDSLRRLETLHRSERCYSVGEAK